MNILFLSLSKLWSLNEEGIYSDLLREFVKDRHNVYILSPIEKRDQDKNIKTNKENNAKIVKLYTGNIQKTNIIEKGFNTLLISKRYKKSIKENFGNVKFDLVLYATPPITLYGAVKYVKTRDNAKTYLMLKDIFPQNAVDIGLLKKTGIRGILYRYFREREKKFYKISDKIGCMSKANVDYLLEHNKFIDKRKVEIFPNSIEIKNSGFEYNNTTILEKYSIPTNRRVFVYGGNLGKPQDIPFVINCLRTQKNNDKVFFVIIGNGTEYDKLNKFVKEENQNNVKLMERLPKSDYDKLISACDVGLIFLSHKFTIPNYPSRLLGYMSAGLPVFAVTDSNTDIGKDIVNGGFGWWCESDHVEKFSDKIEEIQKLDLYRYRRNSKEFLNLNFNIETSYKIIINHFKESK